MPEIKDMTTTAWNKYIGTKERVRQAALKALEEGQLLEIRLERETIEIWDGPEMIEIAPTGKLRVEMIIASPLIQEEKG